MTEHYPVNSSSNSRKEKLSKNTSWKHFSLRLLRRSFLPAPKLLFYMNSPIFKQNQFHQVNIQVMASEMINSILLERMAQKLERK